MKKILKQIDKAKELVDMLVKKISDYKDNSPFANQIPEEYRSLFNAENYQYRLNKLAKINLEKEWKTYKGTIRIKPAQKTVIFRVVRNAAAILLPILMTGSILYFIQVRNKSAIESRSLSTVGPGMHKGELTLSNGETVILGDANQKVILEEDGSVIVNDSLHINYATKSERTNMVNTDLYNELNIRKGWEYSMTLDDGTKVWLNSMSKMRYPVKFNAKERIVEVSEGEVYFEVSENKNRPFIVKTPNYSVKVLGTSFNLRHYNNDEIIHTTLLEGSVEIFNIPGKKNERHTLKPNQQIQFNKTHQELEILNVNASIYSEWTKGYFVFDDDYLEDIFKTLERWYDVEVFFEDQQVRQELFTGKLPRFDNLEDLLQMIEKVSKVKFELQNNYLLIKIP